MPKHTNNPDDDEDQLMTLEEAQDVLAVGDAAMKAAILDGKLRRVQHEGETYVLRHDVDRLAADRDPKALAARVPRL